MKTIFFNEPKIEQCVACRQKFVVWPGKARNHKCSKRFEASRLAAERAAAAIDDPSSAVIPRSMDPRRLSLDSRLAMGFAMLRGAVI